MAETAETMDDARACEVERLFLQQVRQAAPIVLPEGWRYEMHTVAVLLYSRDGDTYVRRIKLEDLRAAVMARDSATTSTRV